MRIVLANNTVASYPQGGGHWSCFLQYLFGLNALGHEVFWLEILASTGNSAHDQRLIQVFLARFKRFGLHNRCALLLFEENAEDKSLDAASVFGMSKERVAEIARDADLLWNFACSLRQSLLSLFKRRVLIDLDPGHLQVSARTWDMGIHEHHAFLTVGMKLHDRGCEVPTLGVEWRRFLPFVHLPMWSVAPQPQVDAPFTSVTQWTWEELEFEGRRLSVSKRDAYLQYIDLPTRTLRRFELAANLAASDPARDRELMRAQGWDLVNPHRVARSVALYQSYIRRSRAEFCCPKPIHRQLNTGWFSDRSAGYLASGRPVLAEDTGFSQHLPTGSGLIAFADAEEAAAGVKEIDCNYGEHSRRARALAEEYLTAEKWLPIMLAACG